MARKRLNFKLNIKNLDGREVLKLPVRMLDDVLRLGPIRGGVDPDLVVLVCGEQLGAVHRVEVRCGGAGDAVKAPRDRGGEWTYDPNRMSYRS